MNIKLNVAELNVKIENIAIDRIPENFQQFIGDFEDSSADIVYKFHDTKQFKNRREKVVAKYLRNEICFSGNAYIKKSIMMDDDGTEYDYFTEFMWGQKEIKVYIPINFVSEKAIRNYFNNFLMFDCVIGWHHRILMHASIVKYQEEAILFTGPSGVGKSTQSNLWQAYRGADILNGDRAILDTDGEELIAYGSPYAGSSGIYRNERCKVKAIIFLTQEKENCITKLSEMEAYKALFPRFSVIRWERGAADNFLSMIMKVIGNTPVYHLGCRPDREAVELTYREVFK